MILVINIYIYWKQYVGIIFLSQVIHCKKGYYNCTVRELCSFVEYVTNGIQAIAWYA